MLQFFRNIFKTKIGVIFTLAFLVLIALAFASADVAGIGNFNGISGGDNVATVSGDKISASELRDAATNSLDQARQQNPTLSMQELIQQGGLTDVLDQMIDRTALATFGQTIGLRAGDNLVNSEIRQIPSFQGPNGQFDENLYRQALATQKLTDKQVRRDLGQGLLAEQILVPTAFGAKMPEKMAARYSALVKERRLGAVAILPSTLFAPTAKPTEKQLTAYYDAHKNDFIRPERRVIRYAVFGPEAVGNVAPTDAEIKAAYDKDKATKYAARDERTYTQLIVPTQQAADVIRKKVEAGTSLEAEGRQAGLEPSKLTATDQKTLASDASAAVAKAVFSTSAGQLAQPVQGSLGWYVIRVDSVKTIPAKTLADVRTEIVDALTKEKLGKALADMSSEVEDQFDGGDSLSDVAKSLKLAVETTQPVVADGRVYGGKPGETAPAILSPVLRTAFEMDEGQPQIAAEPDGQHYILFETSQITESAPAPFKEITDDVTNAWRTSEGAKAAKAAADRILDRVAKGDALAKAVSAEKTRLPPVESLNLTREEITRGGKRVPPPLALLFSMAQGTTKKLEGPNNAGWFVIDLDKIEPGKIDPKDPEVAAAANSLGQLLGREYSEAMRVAIRQEVKVERNQQAIDQLTKQLTGSAN
ncbi:peptidylprolyl isomerase [Tsuneonella mangrovi]|uniref:peptidylprolyl isomerase n=1 Tax=Tsuneonella mangrovi TaxID=1982042 RepID=UPI000BA24EC5|nr:peptidylprolyl isomerase [Tsuneonella mangrovi]